MYYYCPYCAVNGLVAVYDVPHSYDYREIRCCEEEEEWIKATISTPT